MPSDKEMRAAMAEGLRALVSNLPSYNPDLPTHRGYDIVLLVRAHDLEQAQVMSNLMPEAAHALMVACAAPSSSGPGTSSSEATISHRKRATRSSSKNLRTRSTTRTARARRTK